MTRIVACIKIDDGEPGPFDAAALEAALRLPDAEVTVLCMGPAVAENALRTLLRLGVHRAVLLCDPAFAGADTLATAHTLSAALRVLQPDLILCGRQSMSGDTAQVGPSLAAMLDIPLAAYALTVSLDGRQVVCHTRDGLRSYTLPTLITVERSYNLRFPRARSVQSGSFERWGADDFPVDLRHCGRNGSPTVVIQTLENRCGRRCCRFVAASEIPALIEQNRHKKNTASMTIDSPTKLGLVWSVGSEIYDTAVCIGTKVECVESGDLAALASLARERSPDAILFPADAQSRIKASRLATALQTGLCADCTGLEVVNGELIMVRPARGGTLMGKIRCRTRPAMATVRIAAIKVGEVMLGMGKGARGYEAEIAQYARLIGGELVASRAAVDDGMAPYDAQVGLTGRSVAPSVYLALGISGALAHTVAIEGSGCIIAVNRDPDARIFDYADFGVIGEVREVLTAICERGR